MLTVSVIIPAYNEVQAVGHVLSHLPDDLDEIILVDNNSTDGTGEKAKTLGITVLKEAKRGYGYACLKGIDYLKSKKNPPDVVVF